MSDRSRNDEANATSGEELTIEPSAEMAEALREATLAFEARESQGEGAGGGASGDSGAGEPASADKLTIELLSQELQDLKRFHEQKVKEFEEQRDHFLRLQAEFENFRRRSLKEKQESLRFGHQNIVKDLLSAVDNLERALEHGAQNAGAEVRGVLDGIALVHREILTAFEKHGVSQLDAQGQTFDPAVHEAIGQIPSAEVAANVVLQVLQKGYVIHDRMVRPSRVLVAREPTPQERGSMRGD
ncbi:nucleotide exchange factor GrpE [Myxococcota bacterium]|nr:nucleotide exchange factor GrpE [Myxococcota bacterium]